MILRLRLNDGVSKEAFKQKFEVEILNVFGNEIRELEEKKLIIVNNNIYLSDRGKEVANLVWEKFV